MPYVQLSHSPLAEGPSRIHYRDLGNPGGFPILFLHGGWGYQIYSFDRVLPQFERDFRVLIPDRTGYGQSPRMARFPIDFHDRAALETAAFLEAVAAPGAILWGHSDGAVIAAKLGLAYPGRFRAAIMEAFHYYRCKPGSLAFFATMVRAPGSLGERVVATLAADHGRDYWKQAVRMNGEAWLEIRESASRPDDDLYAGNLGNLEGPALFVHGGRDPRTEPDELAEVERRLPGRVRIIEAGGHCPHSESGSAAECARVVREFLD